MSQTQPVGRYQADYWYRHESDDDRTIRHHCQMTGPVQDATAPMREITSLQAGGYIVQRVELYALCSRCQGTGRIGKRPKGVRKTTVLPSWRLTWVECPTCHGQPEYSRFVIFPVQSV
jgi:hypothetical protein